ncbi:zinc ribbon domain-containing protein [Aggregatibacter kilianii]|uniref:zinc ribbon domain-containing protein n=1 Tax=Aggregatibacter kilianii TaxID=2025884 RepID=UPI000D64694B|nr:zinc ribbon domain-containing protein [Aggregatibacter kilianii]RDE85141.1 zinc-ribbon domain-containing protein [Aggregatibacter aphrophilus]
MMLHRCPECRKKISESAEFCPNCGFSFKPENLEIYKQKLEERRLYNEEINRKSVKIHLIWGAIFALVLIVAGWLTNNP